MIKTEIPKRIETTPITAIPKSIPKFLMTTIGMMDIEEIGINGDNMEESKNRCSELMDKIDKKQNITYEEFIELIGFGLEMQFNYKKRKFGVSHFDGFEFYEWDIEEGYQSYLTIEDFANKINIDGTLVKDIWTNVTKVNFAD